jgi:beta-xylosidase
MEFVPAPGSQAGLVCYYDTKSFIKWSATGEGGGRLELEECRQGVRRLVATLPLSPGRCLYLRVRVDGLRRSFDFSNDGRVWKLGGEIPDASFLSDQGTPGWGFTGTMVGLLAVNADPSSKAFADFDWFRFAHHLPETKP